jgi:hypothetical protein
MNKKKLLLFAADDVPQEVVVNARTFLQNQLNNDEYVIKKHVLSDFDELEEELEDIEPEAVIYLYSDEQFEMVDSLNHFLSRFASVTRIRIVGDLTHVSEDVIATAEKHAVRDVFALNGVNYGVSRFGLFEGESQIHNYRLDNAPVPVEKVIHDAHIENQVGLLNDERVNEIVLQEFEKLPTEEDADFTKEDLQLVVKRSMAVLFAELSNSLTKATQGLDFYSNEQEEINEIGSNGVFEEESEEHDFDIPDDVFQKTEETEDTSSFSVDDEYNFDLPNDVLANSSTSQKEEPAVFS